MYQWVEIFKQTVYNINEYVKKTILVKDTRYDPPKNGYPYKEEFSGKMSSNLRILIWYN